MIQRMEKFKRAFQNNNICHHTWSCMYYICSISDELRVKYKYEFSFIIIKLITYQNKTKQNKYQTQNNNL